MQIVDVCYVICINESFEIKESKEAVYWLQHDERIHKLFVFCNIQQFQTKQKSGWNVWKEVMVNTLIIVFLTNVLYIRYIYAGFLYRMIKLLRWWTSFVSYET